MRREKTEPISEIIKQFIKSERLEEGLLRVEIYQAWDKVVGEKFAEKTSGKYYDSKTKTLTCKISSSMFRSHLQFDIGSVINNINSYFPEPVVEKIFLR